MPSNKYADPHKKGGVSTCTLNGNLFDKYNTKVFQSASKMTTLHRANSPAIPSSPSNPCDNIPATNSDEYIGEEQSSSHSLTQLWLNWTPTLQPWQSKLSRESSCSHHNADCRMSTPGSFIKYIKNLTFQTRTHSWLKSRGGSFTGQHIQMMLRPQSSLHESPNLKGISKCGSHSLHLVGDSAVTMANVEWENSSLKFTKTDL